MNTKMLDDIMVELYRKVDHIYFGDSVVRKTARNEDDLRESILFEFHKALEKIKKVV